MEYTVVIQIPYSVTDETFSAVYKVSYIHMEQYKVDIT